MGAADGRGGGDSHRPDGEQGDRDRRDRLLAALLAVDPDRARTIRAGTARPRPRPQVGPSADHGAG